MDDIFYHDDHNPGGIVGASLAVERMLKSLGCEYKMVKISQESTSCTQLKHSKMCEIQSDVGFFVVIKDLVDGGYVMFNRYD